VVPGLGNLNDLLLFGVGTEGEGEPKAACEVGREGRGEYIFRSGDFAGDRGDWTVTLGGDLALVGDLVGEKTIIEVGRGFELLCGVRTVLARGVTDPAGLNFAKLGEG
jgi:hypothetical protein